MPRLLLVGILFAAIPAAASDAAPTLGIVGLHQGELTALQQEEAVSIIAEAVDATGKADGMETKALINAITGREEVILQDALLAAGRQDLLNGKNAYNQAETDDAITALQSAVENLSVAVRATNTVKELWEAWVYLGTAQMQNGETEAAEGSLRAAAALNPDRLPNPAQFPPDVVAAYNTQKVLLTKAAVTFQINADKDATLFLDGRELGKAPQAVAGVFPGMHHLVAKGERAYAYQLLRVDQSTDGKAPDVALTLGEPEIGSAADSEFGRARQISGLYRALGAHAQGVDLWLLAGIERSQLQLQLYSPSAEAFSKPVLVAYADSAADEAANAIPQLTAMLTDDGKILPEQVHPSAISISLDQNRHLASLLVDPRKPVVNTVGSVGPPPKKRSPVVPIIIGVVAAGALGTGGALGYSALTNDDPKYGGTVVIGPF